MTPREAEKRTVVSVTLSRSGSGEQQIGAAAARSPKYRPSFHASGSADVHWLAWRSSRCLTRFCAKDKKVSSRTSRQMRSQARLFSIVRRSRMPGIYAYR